MTICNRESCEFTKEHGPHREGFTCAFLDLHDAIAETKRAWAAFGARLMQVAALRILDEMMRTRPTKPDTPKPPDA